MTVHRRAIDIVRFFRVRDWWYFLPLPLTTMTLAQPPSWRTAAAFALAAGCLAFAYGWNQVADIDLTTARRGTQGASPRMLKGSLAVVLVTTALLGFAVGAPQSVITTLSLTGGAVYSGGPRIKRFPVVCTIANAWIFSPLCLLGMSGWHAPEGSWLLTALFTCLLLQNQLLHEAAHAPADRNDEILTTFLHFGPQWTRAGVLAFGLVEAALLGLAAHNTARTAAAVASIGGALLLLATAAAVLPADALALPERAARIRARQRAIGLFAGAFAWCAERWLA